jgi:hypothetical protein
MQKKVLIATLVSSALVLVAGFVHYNRSWLFGRKNNVVDEAELATKYSYTVIADTSYILGSTPDQHLLPETSETLYLDTLEYGDEVYSSKPLEYSSMSITGSNSTTRYPSGRYFFGEYLDLVAQKRATPPSTDSENVVSTEEFEEYYKPIFTHPAYGRISPYYKRAIVKYFKDNDYYGEFFLTPNPARSQYVVAFGHFTRTYVSDVACLFENKDTRSSLLIVFASNVNTSEVYVAYQERFSSLPIINSFRSGALIFMDSRELVPAPSPGIIIKDFPNDKLALLFNPAVMRFATYKQKPKAEVEIRAAEEEPAEEQRTEVQGTEGAEEVSE